MTQQQWFRRFQLITAARGQGLSIDNMGDAGVRLKFEITKSLQKEPNQAKFEIYNLNPDSVAAIQDEYTDVIFNAGYEGNMKLLFTGNTQFVSHYRDKVDWITELVCGDGDLQFRKTFVNTTFAAGSTDEQIVDHCRKQLGVLRGTWQLNGAGSLRGRTYSKMAHQVLDEIARTNGCNWSIQDGKLQIIRADAMLGDRTTATVLTAETGLLQAAERTDKGITVKSLLNPNIAVNSAIKLDNARIRAQSTQRRKLTSPPRQKIVALNKDGIYKVFKVRHSGDTRANDWFTEILCVGLGQPVPTSTSNTSAAVPVEGA